MQWIESLPVVLATPVAPENLQIDNSVVDNDFLQGETTNNNYIILQRASQEIIVDHNDETELNCENIFSLMKISRRICVN